MSVIKLRDESEMSPEVLDLDRKLRSYTGAPRMTNYAKAASYKPKYLENLALGDPFIMANKGLKRRTKELIAVAVSMINRCAYSIYAHTNIIRREFGADEEEIVELATVVAHISGINSFEKAIMTDAGETLLPRASNAEIGTLKEITAEFGQVPLYYEVMANEPEHLKLVWAREKAIMLEGNISRADKELIALAVSAINGCGYSCKLHFHAAKRLGLSEPQILEALWVVDLFNKNNKFLDALQIPLGVWADKAV